MVNIWSCRAYFAQCMFRQTAVHGKQHDSVQRLKLLRAIASIGVLQGEDRKI